jgi:hypothetical protein
MKMEAVCSSETSGHTRTTLRHIPEDYILQEDIFDTAVEAFQTTVVFQCCPSMGMLSFFFIFLRKFTIYSTVE